MIFAENLFFCCENSSVERGETPTGGPRPTLPTPSCCPPQAKIITHLETAGKPKKQTKERKNLLAHPLGLARYWAWDWRALALTHRYTTGAAKEKAEKTRTHRSLLST